jgi:hypothetical protein
MTTIASTAAVDILSTKPNIRRSPSKKDRKSLKKKCFLILRPSKASSKIINENYQRLTAFTFTQTLLSEKSELLGRQFSSDELENYFDLKKKTENSKMFSAIAHFSAHKTSQACVNGRRRDPKNDARNKL